MSKDKTNETTNKPEAEEAPKKPQAVIKVVAIAIDEEYTEPEGWVLKEIHSVDVESGKFFGVLVKILDTPNSKPKTRMSEPVNLKS